MAKAIRIVDPAAIALVNKRAETENRSAANAAATTVIEALRGVYGTPKDVTPKDMRGRVTGQQNI